MIKRTFFILLMVNILMLCGTVEEVVADDKKAKAGIIDLESITITASRMKGAAHESSYNITIINEADIEQAHAKSTPDLLKDLEGVYVYDSSGVGTTGRVNMRGFWGGMSTNQLVLIDGVPQNKASDKLVNWDLIPVDNIKSIEIVRGPVSALYGDNAMSGVINIITKAPTAQPKLKVSGSYLRYNTQNYNAYVSGMIKKFGYYFAVSSKSTDGFRRHSDYANINVLGKIDLKVNETETLKFSSAYHEKKEGAFPWALTEAQMDEDRRRARPGTQSDKSKVRKSDSSLTYLNEVNADLNMEGTLYYRYEDVDSYYTPTARFTSTVEQIDYENVYGLLLSCSTTPKIFNMEYLLAAGVDLELDDFDYKEYAAPFQARSVRIGDYTVNRKKAGPYIHGEVKVSELLKLSTAIRYDFVAFDFTDQLDAPKSRIRNMSNINLNCGIVSNYRKKSKFYVNYGQAFRTPTFGEMFTYGGAANPDLNPEKAFNYETGILHYINKYLTANFTFYWMYLDNEIWFDYTDRRYENYGRTSHLGLESGASLKFCKGLTAFVNYSYTRAQNEAGEDKGKLLTNVPSNKCSFGGSYDTGIGLRASAVVTNVGASYIDPSNSDKLPDYITVDAKFDYNYKGLSLFLIIDNVLNRKYNTYGFKRFGAKYFSPAPGRMFGAGAEVKF